MSEPLTYVKDDDGRSMLADGVTFSFTREDRGPSPRSYADGGAGQWDWYASLGVPGTGRGPYRTREEAVEKWRQMRQSTPPAAT